MAEIHLYSVSAKATGIATASVPKVPVEPTG